MRDTFVDRAIYPFDGHSMEVEGGRMHYLDEGEGPAIVFVHGTPTWSFLYRHLIRQLSPHYRCVAPDHLGFGLSDKPESADYRPEAHARRLAALIGDRSRFPKEAHHHYRKAFPNVKSRTAPWVLARELIGSSDGYEGLWERRQAIAEKPALLLWGMDDSAFTPQHLERWRGLFPNAQVEEYAGAGHFVMEERDREIAPVVERFLAA